LPADQNGSASAYAGIHLPPMIFNHTMLQTIQLSTEAYIPPGQRVTFASIAYDQTFVLLQQKNQGIYESMILTHHNGKG